MFIGGIIGRSYPAIPYWCTTPFFALVFATFLTYDSDTFRSSRKIIGLGFRIGILCSVLEFIIINRLVGIFLMTCEVEVPTCGESFAGIEMLTSFSLEIAGFDY